MGGSLDVALPLSVVAMIRTGRVRAGAPTAAATATTDASATDGCGGGGWANVTAGNGTLGARATVPDLITTASAWHTTHATAAACRQRRAIFLPLVAAGTNIVVFTASKDLSIAVTAFTTMFPPNLCFPESNDWRFEWTK